MFRNTDTELFLDDHAIADTVRLERVWRQPRKFGPVLTPDRPWEKHCVIMYGSILPRPEGTGYQAWYQTFSTHVRGPERAVFCYAESDDGVTWEKPVIGDYEWQGSRDNNIFFIHPDTKWLSTLTVACDVDEPDESRRYKLLHSMHTYDEPGICVMFSADGKHWQPHDEPVLANASDRTTLLHAPGRDAPWIAYCRRHGMMQEHRSRIVYRSESADFVDWSDPEPCLAPDLEDSWDQQFYAMPAFRYRNLYLAGVQRLWSTPDTLDVELIVSRDTVNWTRSRNTFLPVGSAGEWDCAWVGLASSPPIERDGWLWFYHEGRDASHVKSHPLPHGAVGLAMLKKDRFAGLQAGPVEGIVTTKPFRYDGTALRVNVDARGDAGPTDAFVKTGVARVEIVDDDGTPMPGFSYDDAVPMQDDDSAWEPRWGDDPSLDALRGRDIALRMYLSHATLYAVTLDEPA